MPEELRNMTMGIVGYGSIGREIARLAKPLACTSWPSNRAMIIVIMALFFRAWAIPTGTLPDRYYTMEQFHDLLKASDVVVIAVPLTPRLEISSMRSLQ